MPGAPLLPATVAAAWDETPTLRGVALDVPPALREGHRLPGQYLMLRVPPAAETAYFALASAPGARPELLIRKGGQVADRLLALPTGGALELGPAEGPGFPLADARGRDLLLVCTGAGLAPIRAVLQQIERAPAAYGEVHLFLGVSDPDEVPYRAELRAAEERGLRLHLAFSHPGAGATGQLVQERLRQECPSLARAEAFLCGQPAMVQAVTRWLGEAGLPRERVHLNV